MSRVFFDGFGNSIDGKIERIQIQREDGSIRLNKEINTHNTIVDCGLDNVLTVGGFPNGAKTNNKYFDIFNKSVDYSRNYQYFGLMYDLAKWIRMLWFVQLGTETEDTITTYDMTSLVQPYYNADGETYSQSHYIPTSENTAIRGTTHESYIEGDVHATHRITSNSIKISEDNVTITEIGFFVGINETFDIDWFNQKFNVGDMFCRIKLGENKVTLNKGERLVITYALTEYAGCTSPQAIADIHLAKIDGTPIYHEENGKKYTISAIARAWVCDGRPAKRGTNDSKLPGPFTNIASTVDAGSTYGIATTAITPYYEYDPWTNAIYKPGCYAYASSYNKNNIDYFLSYNYFTKSETYFYGPGCSCYPFLVGLSENLYDYNTTTSNIRNYNSFDTYGFPKINTQQMYYGSIFNAIIGYTNDAYKNNRLAQAGRCRNNTSDPTPYGNNTGCSPSNNIHPIPTIKAYTRGTFYRDHEFVIPTYMPRIESTTSTLPAPNGSSNIYWLIINGMIYKIGYFDEGYEGNINHFNQCSIKKKYGQVFRCTFREHIGRRNDVNGSTGSKLVSDASKISSVTIRATTNLNGVMTTNYKPLQTLNVEGTNNASDAFVFEIPYSNKTNDTDVIQSIKFRSVSNKHEETIYEYTYSWNNLKYQDALAGWKLNVGIDAEGVKHAFDLFGENAQLYKNYIKFIDKNGNESEWLHVYDHTITAEGEDQDGN